jgi:hypothetical protein
MKEWLEEKDMPKDCATCKYYVLNCSDTYSCIKQNGKAIHCNFSEGMGYRHEDCPFQSLADYTKQVRKEVCQKIRENAISHNNLEVDMYYITPQQLYEIERGETECQKN